MTADRQSESSQPSEPRASKADLYDELVRDLEERLRDELAPGLEVVGLLGRGTAAVVYLAREPSLRRLVAVKVLAPWLRNDKKSRLRFEREAQAAARISHPNVVAIHWVGSLASDVPYIVMQHIRGRSLQDRMRAEGRLEGSEVRRILADVASGLGAAHRQRIVHRDVKPANILFEEETGRVYLTDFGIAGMLASGGEEVSQLTTTGHVLGDARYVSPEHLEGHPLTELADIYSLGIVGFQLAAGQGPYEAESPADLVHAHLQDTPRRLSEVLPDADPILEELLARCLQRTPHHRPGASDVVRHLSRGRGTDIDSAAPTGAVEETPDASASRPVESPPAGEAADAATEDEPPALPADQGREALASRRGQLRLQALGSLDLTTQEGTRLLSVLAQPKRVALLLYLALGARQGFKRRDTLLGVFWSDVEEERARHALRQALYVLRRALGSNVVVSRGDEELGVDRERVWCDAAAFEAAVDAGRSVDALELYEGDLLPGFYLDDAPEFERWLENERRRLRRKAADSAWAEADQRENTGDLAEASRWARRAQELTPFDETSLCRLIGLLDRIGDRAGAIKAYDQFARLLESAYEAEPAPETRALIQRIRDR